MQVHLAEPDDWAAIWPFLSCIVADGETYCWPRDTSESDARTWWMNKPGGRVYVAVDDDGTVLGTAEMHPNQPAGGAHVANAGFMVSHAAFGRGVGRAMALHLLEDARRLGFHAMQFNAVVESNTRAIELWQSLGFRILATVPEAFEHPKEGLIGLHIMYRRL